MDSQTTTDKRRTYADTIQERLNHLRDSLDRRARGEDVSLFIRTGLTAWDNNGGIGRGELTVIGAATGDGKSIVKLHLATRAAADGLKVLMVDMEDSGSKTADRTLSKETGLDNKRMERLDIGGFELDMLTAAHESTSKWAANITHIENGQTTAAVLKAMKADKYDLILVDYAQAFPEDPGENMERTVARFAWAANEHAKTTKCAVVVFSQLNSKVEERGYKQLERARFRDPTAIDVTGFCPNGKTDIAWAKELGEKAKTIIYLFRPGRVARTLGSKGAKDNRLQVIVAKRNFGSEDQMIFAFDGPTATISDLKEK